MKLYFYLFCLIVFIKLFIFLLYQLTVLYQQNSNLTNAIQFVCIVKIYF